MSAINPSQRARNRPGARQSGTSAIEFALVCLVFFTFVFGIFEVSRLLFVYNTLQEVTRRAAAAAVNVFPRDADGIAQLKHDAVFRNSAGELVLASPVSNEHVRLDYLAYDLSPIAKSAWPSCAAQNRQVCMANPHAPNCIRFVQVRICDPGNADSCSQVTSRLLVPLVPLAAPLPKAETIASVETLGYHPGTPPCTPLPPGT